MIIAFFIIMFMALFVGSAICILCKVSDGRFPRPVFATLIAPIWLDKAEDVGTIVADDIDKDLDCTKWTKRTDYDFTRIDNSFSVNPDRFSGRATVTSRGWTVDSFTVEASTWGDHRLYKAISAWKVRKALLDQKVMDERANKALKDTKATLQK